ncbi:MAG: hypothetical protein LBT46_08965 [Planctomycetaceae bacterium]|nr:hypothetical protein [Planctomycetaceae bacterium]
MPVQQEPDNPFTVPLPAHTAQPQPAGKATNWDGGEILGGVLGGSAGFVIGAMIARNIILENPNLTMTEVTKTASLFPGYPPIPTQHIVLPNGGGLGVFLVITLVFTVFGMFIGEKIGKKK